MLVVFVIGGVVSVDAGANGVEKWVFVVGRRNGGCFLWRRRECCGLGAWASMVALRGVGGSHRSLTFWVWLSGAVLLQRGIG